MYAVAWWFGMLVNVAMAACWALIAIVIAVKWTAETVAQFLPEPKPKTSKIFTHPIPAESDIIDEVEVMLEEQP